MKNLMALIAVLSLSSFSGLAKSESAQSPGSSADDPFAQPKEPGKEAPEDYQRGLKQAPTKSSLQGEFTTDSESEWSASLKLQPRGKLMIQVKARAEDGSADQRTINGTWEISGEKLVLKYQNKAHEYEFYPKSQSMILKKKVDLLVPISDSQSSYGSFYRLSRKVEGSRP